VSTPEVTKSRLRRQLSAARKDVPAAVRNAETAALSTVSLPGLPTTVCAYWPVGTEPGAPELLDRLRHRGCRVLLPVIGTPDGPATALDWAEYTGAGSLQAGPLGLREPAGRRLGSAAITLAGVVLVPALAVDHRGARLGRGGGYYDRTLPLATPGTVLVAVVRDDEVLPWLPAEPHDVPVTAILTPRAGLRLVSA
jgi:5-formyltetrahydrofolate cyclo-ligase